LGTKEPRITDSLGIIYSPPEVAFVRLTLGYAERGASLRRMGEVYRMMVKENWLFLWVISVIV
jgi:hypothetical protein